MDSCRGHSRDSIDLGTRTPAARHALRHPDWTFEIKFDGFRLLAYVENGKCNLVSRRANAFKRFPDLRIALPSDLTGVTEAVLDGEIVVLDERGASLFGPLMSSNSRPVYTAFDLVWLNGKDLSDLPLLERKKRLRSIVRKNASRVLYVDHVVGLGNALFAEVCKQDMEGIVAKLAMSSYKAPRSRSPWMKIKNPTYAQEGRGELFNRRR
jgi:bifunctional non-homologous end joining protein LigD